MKFEIIHLSDFHINRSFDYKKYVRSIIDSIIFEDDENLSKKIAICITGDLANSGSYKQYEIFDNFLKELRENIEQRGREAIIYFVPGNHDIYLEESEERIKSINEAINKNEFDVLLEQDIENMKPFFKLSSKYGIFDENKFVSIKKIDIDGEIVQFNLLNTACLSLRTKDDKEKHFIPLDLLSFDANNSFFNITLMHHSNEWFTEECEYKLDDILNNSSMYLYGHQHKQNYIEKEGSLGFLATEVKIDNHNWLPFKIFLLNFENSIIRSLNVNYNYDLRKYIRQNEVDAKIFERQKRDSIISYYKFKKELEDSDRLFVMPTASINNGEKTISDLKELILYIKSNKYVKLQGYSRGGKTTLLKRICLQLLKENYYILYVKNTGLISNNFENSIKHIFSDNYDRLTFEAFLQEKRERKVIVFDEGAILKEEKYRQFIKECTNNFEMVIFTNDLLFKGGKEIIYENSLDDFKNIKIEPFTLFQRNLLVEKYAELYNQKDNVEIIIKCLESVINNDTFIDLTNPENLSQLLDNLIKNRLYEERNTMSSFSIIYENNIINSIRSNIKESCTDASFNIITKIAYFMYKKEKECYKITLNDIEEIFTLMKEEFGYNINKLEFVQMLITSRIMKEENEVYQFTRNSYYSYFVAQNIVNMMQNDPQYMDDIINLTDNIVFGNYSDILMFIAYLSKNRIFFENIMKYINDYIKSWKKLSFDSKNHYILERIIKDGSMYSDDFESTDQHNKRRDNDERKHIEFEERSTNEEKYKEVSKDSFYEAIKVLKLIEVLSKGINGYGGLINVELRRKMVEATKDGLYCLIYKVFDFSNEEYDDLYLELAKENDKQEEHKKINPEKLSKIITNIFYRALTNFSLNLFICICNVMASPYSLRIINDIPDKDENGNLIFDNVLFKAIYYERNGKETAFISYLEKIYDDIKNVDYKKMMNKVFYLFVITSSISSDNIEKMSKIMKLDKRNILVLKPNVKNKIAKLTNKIDEKILD